MLGWTAGTYPAEMNSMFHSGVNEAQKNAPLNTSFSVKSLHPSTFFFKRKKKHVLLDNKFHLCNHHMKVKLWLAEDKF